MKVCKKSLIGILASCFLITLCMGEDIHKAAMEGDLAKVEALIAENPGLTDAKDEMGRNPLIYAVSRGHRKVVELLLNKGADVNIQDNAGYSPVHIAAFRGNKEMLEFLISKGANLNRKNKMGVSVLHDMAMQGQKEIVALLIDKGADFMMEDTSGQTPLHLASNHGHKDVVELFLKKGADVNQKGSGGDTPLHGAAWMGDKPTVEILIANNAQINAKNENGNTPLDNALRRGSEDIVDFLMAHKAKGRTDLKMKSQKIISDRIEQEGMDTPLKFTILYDNYLYEQGTKPDWGFSCLIEGTEKVILFDTGTQPDILLHNVNHLGVDLKKVEQIVLSHDHHDHIGGLPKVLDRNPNVSVYMPVSFAYEIVRSVERKNAKVVSIDEPVEICQDVYSTGEMGVQIKEQSLIINTKKGLIIVTGCSHQGIVNILKRAKKLFDRPIYLVFGGFHLGGMADEKVAAIIQDFKEIGVEKCGATHCTGDRPIELFKEAFGDNYVPMGTGRILEIKQ